VQSLSHGQQKLAKQLEYWKAPLDNIAIAVNEVLDATKLAKQKEAVNWISPIAFENHHA
jgi:hypothetical protein